MSGSEAFTTNILHDHYKESFTQIREREKRRDKTFLLLAVLLGLLFLEVEYPTVVKDLFKETSASAVKIDPSMVPIAILASLTWSLLLVFVIRYCQMCITVDRQYDYLHMLEDRLSPLVGDGKLYRREGKVYLDDYPAFSKWAWFFYVVVFPLTTAVVCIAMLVVEFSQEDSQFNVWYDLVMLVGVAVSLGLYRGVGFFKRLNEKPDQPAD